MDRLGLSRREFVALSAAPLLFPSLASAATCVPPPAFPADVPLTTSAYENWSQEQRADAVWTAAPRTAADVCVLADWARANGWVLRPRGMMHSWGPLTIRPGTTCADKVVLIDTTAHLRGITVGADYVAAEAGALLEDVSARLQDAGLGLTGVPAVGAVTVGGVLAIDGHGATLPAHDEDPHTAAGFGTLSDLVMSITAVVWSQRRGRYVLRTFTRTDPRCDALMVSLGRAFITSVRLRVAPSQRLRCQSLTDVPAAELFAASGPRTFSSYLDASGRAEAIWFPFTESPWLKVWTVAPEKPATAREVTAPYNYSFSDNLPVEITTLADQLVTGNPGFTPVFGQALYNATVAGLAATDSGDLWGWSKDVQYYIKATTLRVAQLGYGIVCSRADVQWVLHTAVGEYRRRLEADAAAGRYPINMPLELRVSGLDDARAVGIAGARPPLISAARAVRRRPEWDCIVWLNVLDLTGTAGAPAFKASLERWLQTTFDGTRALARAEWSKGWAFDDAAPWRRDRFPAVAAPHGRRLRTAARHLRALDPHGVFRIPVLGRLLN